MKCFPEAALKRANKQFTQTGTSVAAWARDRGFHRNLVYEILRGNKKCLRGKSHQIAVLLGLKEGDVIPMAAPSHAVARVASGRRK